MLGNGREGARVERFSLCSRGLWELEDKIKHRHQKINITALEKRCSWIPEVKLWPGANHFLVASYRDQQISLKCHLSP